MAKKHETAIVSESVAEQVPNGIKSEKKKKKKKDEQNEANPKRKVEEVEIHDDTESNKKSKKHKKSKENTRENGTVEGNDGNKAIDGDESVRDRSVVVTGKNVKGPKYEPLKTFSASGLPENVLECCKNFEKPSPIQSRAWPFLLDGRDLIGIAATGSGKTLAFGIPAIVHVQSKCKGKASKGRNPLCLVLSPTRELAQQEASKNIKSMASEIKSNLISRTSATSLSLA